MTQKNENNKNDLIILSAVSETEEGQRLDRFLASKTAFSRSRISVLIKDGCVFKNGRPVDSADKKVRVSEIYGIHEPEPVPAEPLPERIALDIAYEDDDLLVINKPAGLVVHPAHGHHSGTLVNALLAHCAQSLSGIGGVARPGIVHRLDKDTSGLMVVAKNDLTHQGLSEQFAVHSLERCYKALVWGLLSPQSGEIETQIGRSRLNRQKMAVLKEGGKYAKTLYKTLQIFEGGLFSLVECSLKTGRTHQVRVHMTHSGHPLLGDAVYGKTPKNAKNLPDFVKNFPRQALHSYKMSFVHPKTGRTLRFESPLPPDMQNIVESFSEE